MVFGKTERGKYKMLIVKPSEGKIGNTHFLFDDAKIVLFFQLKKKKEKKASFFSTHRKKCVLLQPEIKQKTIT